MLFRLVTEDQRDRMAWLFHEGREFYLCNPVVEQGGLGVDSPWHLVANHATSLWPIPRGPFRSFPYNVRSCADIAMARGDPPVGMFGKRSSLLCFSIHVT